MAQQGIIPGSRYDSTTPVLLNLQSPTGVPRSSRLTSVTSPLGVVPSVDVQLNHFWPGLYDLSPESHLSRLLKVILGETGIGSVSKSFTVARLNSIVMTTRYLDLDRFYGALLGMRRMFSETLDINPMLEDATPAEWDVIEDRDSAYRSRVETFSRALGLGATVEGMAAVAQAVTGVVCRIHESYLTVDEAFSTPTPPPAGGRTYLDVEHDFGRYSSMNYGSYADIEGGSATFGGSGTLTLNRAEFVVVPTRMLSLEETYELSIVLRRLKPAGSLLRIAPLGLPLTTPVIPRHVSADSVYWDIVSEVAPNKEVEAAYSRDLGPGVPAAQPRSAFSEYQGEAWSFNADVASVVSYSMAPDGSVIDRYNYERVIAGPISYDFTPDNALQTQQSILAGRAVSSAIATSSPYSPDRGTVIF